MRPSLYLTRARLRHDPAIAAIAPLLLPVEISSRTKALHQLIWSLFAGRPDATRDFLWQEDRQGSLFILSHTPPGESPIFTTETKSLSPNLQAGDRLRFSLRANATRSLKTDGAARGKRADVVMAALKSIPPKERAEARPSIIFTEGREWLKAQGQRHGFELATDAFLRIESYESLSIPRPGTKPIQISVLSFEGVLNVNDPETFLAALAKGFGHAKAFGCGLMLIQRAA